ncbi:hypothetical protein BDQ17DRAFT_1386816 [Cyathus striatus]|nr:hypothetical protein BDQ17DRAFT_1386816 [Cyathus striatus]
MPLNYSKWDQLELSDDSDIEGHQIWKQRDIHEKREVRKSRIQQLTVNIDCDTVKVTDPSSSIPVPVYINNLAQQLKTNPSRDSGATYDGMILDLLRGISQKAGDRVKAAGPLTEEEKQERLAKELITEVQFHVRELGKRIEQNKKELEEELKEQKKHITSEDIHEGWESKYIPPPPEPAPVPHAKIDDSKKKVTQFENRRTRSREEEELPELTPTLEAFSKLPLKGYEKSFEFIQAHRDVVVPGASDALLVAAFKAQSDGKSKYAKQCVHQSLLLQYCEKLGPDGVGIFFKKMMAGDKRAEKVFVDDIEGTYNHLVNRVRISQEEASRGREQIQLVPENPDQIISFNVPDGPPPEDIRLEGEEAEKLDIEEVRKMLQLRWDMFESFPKDLQEALKDGTLEKVNDVLGEMDVQDAEAIVQQLDVAGILSFAEGGIRDETGKGKEPEA